MTIVDIIREDRHLVAEHVELEHPLSKGDVLLLTTGDNEYEKFVVLRSQQTIFRKDSISRTVNTEIIVERVQDEQ